MFWPLADGALPIRILKINVDATVRSNGSFLSMVARNRNGKLMEAHSFKLCCRDPMIAELWAIGQALMVCVRNGWRSVLCETDAKNSVFCLNEGITKNMHWSTENMVKEIWFLRSSFDFINFSWCNRRYNNLAHLCAKWAARFNFYGLILEEFFPEDMSVCLALEESGHLSDGVGTTP